MGQQFRQQPVKAETRRNARIRLAIGAASPVVRGLRLAQRRRRLMGWQNLQVRAFGAAPASHGDTRMTFTFEEHQLLLQALDMAISRHQTQADFYEARPLRYATASVTKHQDKAAAMHALACRFSAFRPRHEVLEVA
jgi:hypothetical protein